MLAINAAGNPCRCCRYSGVLKDTQQQFDPSCHASTFNGRSRASVGAATINGVPPAGLPRISNCVGGSASPTAAASLLKLMRANTVMPWLFATLSSRSSVSSTPRAAANVLIPWSESVAFIPHPAIWHLIPCPLNCLLCSGPMEQFNGSFLGVDYHDFDC